MPRVSRIKGAVALAIRHKVADQLEGVHASVHVGRSLDFNDLREYVVDQHIVLYAHSESDVVLLAIKHQRQLVYSTQS